MPHLHVRTLTEPAVDYWCLRVVYNKSIYVIFDVRTCIYVIGITTGWRWPNGITWMDGWMAYMDLCNVMYVTVHV